MLAKHFGYKTPESIRAIEQDYQVCEVHTLFIKNLGNLIGYDLTDLDKSASLIEKIPKKYFKIYRPRDPLKFYNEPL